MKFLKILKFYEICFEILGNLLKFWKKCNRLIPSMVEINECFPEVNMCFSNKKV